MFAFDSLEAFAGMNGYAHYVWPVWGGIALMLAGHMLYVRRERRVLTAAIRRDARLKASSSARHAARADS